MTHTVAGGCRLALLFSLLGWLSASAAYGSALHVDTTAQQYAVESHVDYILDEGWDFQSFRAREGQLSFSRSTTGALTFGYVNAAYWMRLRLHNDDQLDHRWLLELSGLSRAVDRIEAYIPDLFGVYQRHLSGDTVPFHQRTIRHHSVLFRVELPAEQTRTVYLKVTTNGTLQLPMTLWSMDAYLESEHHDTLMEGMFYGILVIMLFYNGFIYWSVKDHSYLYYVCYLVCVLGFSLSIKGVGYEYLWPDYPLWNNKSNLIFATVGIWFVLLFAQSFLKTAEYTPRIHTAIRVLLYSGASCTISLVGLSHYHAAAILAVQCSASIIVVIVAASLSLKRGFTAARYYLLAWLSVLVSILLWILNSANVLSSYWAGAYLYQIGITLQVLLFSFALADRINLMRSEREAALKLQLDHSRKLVSMSEMFERFVPKQFLNKIARSGIENIELGRADVAEVSILFADVRGFTAMSEALQPQELLNFLNAYLERIDKVIHDHDGFIDKFIGDGVMALFENEKSQVGALNAVNAAIRMQKAVELYNDHRANCGYPPIRIGIGVNTGEVVYGTVGSHDRMDSTVLGDNVNVAARLQDLTKVLRARVVISDHTLDMVGKGHGLIVREVGDVRVRGRREPVHIFEVLNADSELDKAAKLHTLNDYRLAYDNYRNGRYKEAERLWLDCLDINPTDTVVQYLIEQCRTNMG
ncbi:MAG: 7TM diverse intracellular signaling domain-containing protein [Pseudomonadota bacterium]|nr:7TM diverse intracellular signaling domain-containing protein [Pseudomonadota bacterium]